MVTCSDGFFTALKENYCQQLLIFVVQTTSVLSKESNLKFKELVSLFHVLLLAVLVEPAFAGLSEKVFGHSYLLSERRTDGSKTTITKMKCYSC